MMGTDAGRFGEVKISEHKWFKAWFRALWALWAALCVLCDQNPISGRICGLRAGPVGDSIAAL